MDIYSVIHVHDEVIVEAPRVKVKAGDVRRVQVLGVCDTLCLLVELDIDSDIISPEDWLCEDLRTGRQRLVSSRYMSVETYNEMEVLAWAAQ